jgi:hypothetical protein
MTIPITNVQLEGLISADLGEPHKGGRQPYWLCPFHDDHSPSLTIKPDGQHWKCFGCGRSGDAIDWVMERQKCSFKEAVTKLGGHVAFPKASSTRVRPPAPWKSDNSVDPDWSLRAEALAHECARMLSKDDSKRARVWLVNRGLKPETLLRWRVGFNSSAAIHHGLWVERGITIPWYLQQEVTALNVRRPVGDPKYKLVQGSSRRGLYLGDQIVPGRPTLLVEGEFDALLGWQAVRGLVNVATQGSATARPDRTAIMQLITSPVILVAYDRIPPAGWGCHRLDTCTTAAGGVACMKLIDQKQNGGRVTSTVILIIALTLVLLLALLRGELR